MIRLKEHLPVALKPVEEVRDEIISTLNDNLARDNANAIAVDLLAAFNAGENELETLAADSGLEYGRHEAVRRSSSVPDGTLVKEVFRLETPAEDETVQAVLPTDNGFAVVELDLVVQGELGEGASATRQQYERVIANGSASQEASGLLKQLRAAADVEVFEDRIK